MNSIIKDFRIRVGEYFLKKRLEKQKRKVVARNLDDIKTAGIIFEVSSDKNITLVKQLISELKKHGIKTKALGYIDDHRKNIDFIGDSTFTYLCKDDYSFFYDTKDSDTLSFINQPFHLLVVFCERDIFTLRSVGMLSKAELKTGESGVCDKMLDMMIEIPENKGLPELQKQLLYYLTMLNKHI